MEQFVHLITLSDPLGPTADLALKLEQELARIDSEQRVTGRSWNIHVAATPGFDEAKQAVRLARSPCVVYISNMRGLDASGLLYECQSMAQALLQSPAKPWLVLAEDMCALQRMDLLYQDHGVVVFYEPLAPLATVIHKCAYNQARAA